MHRTLLALIVVAALLAALPASAPAHFGGAPADSAQKKKRKKAKKCKKSQIKVKVGKRQTCRPFKKAFPKPKAGEPAQLVTNAALGEDWSRIRTRRGKRLPSLPKLIRQAGRSAPSLLARATTRGFARIDAMQAGAGPARVRAAQSDGCSNLSRAPRQRDNFTSDGGDGTRARVRSEMGPDGATLGIDLEGNGLTISLDIDMGLCEPDEVEAPQCPTAAGQLDGQIRYKFKVAIQVSREGEDVWSQTVEVTRRTKLQGFTDVEAKLDRLNVEDLETSRFRLGGSTRAFPPITIRSQIERRTEIDMRSGSYDPGRSRVDATFIMEGLSGPERDDAEAEFERKTQADADRQFAAIIEKAMSGYRSREDAWQTANTCATLKFGPTSNSLTLRGGASGSFTTTAIAKADGGESELDAKLSDMQLASFSPTRAGGQRAQFAYENVVGSAPPGSKVRAKVHATSKAGVAEDTWEQKIEPPFEINQISGNFAGSQSVGIGGRTARITWNGSGRFERTPASGFPGAFGNYFIKAGQATFHYSGQTITAHAACNMRGSAFVDLFQDAGGSIGVNPPVNTTDIFAKGPHDYSGLVSIAGDGPRVTLTMENCLPGAESEEGKTYEIPIAIPPFDTGPGELRRSPDGIDYSGSWSGSHSGASWEYSWTMTGEKVNPAP